VAAGDEVEPTTATSASSAPITAAGPSSAPTDSVPEVAAPPRAADLVVYDPTRPLPPPHDAAKEKRYLDLIFSKPIFPMKFLSAAKLCPAKAGGTLESRRQRGLFAPRIEAAIEGSFTAPKADETFVLASLGECNASLQASYQLAVIQGDAVVASVNSTATRFTDGLISVGAVAALNGDVQSEIVLTSFSFVFGSGMLQSASLVRFDRGKLVTVQDFGLVMTDSCTFPSHSLTYSVIHALIPVGEKPLFVVRDATGTCE
ncbi:MAG: hypothetical protein ACHREM_23480, partial [Polyangiales bacterium]